MTSLDINTILKKANEKFNEYKRKLEEERKSLIEKENAKETITINVKEEDLTPNQRQKLDNYRRDIKDLKIAIKNGKDFCEICKTQLMLIDNVYGFNIKLGRIADFIQNVSNLAVPDSNTGTLQVLKDYGKVAGISYPISPTDLDSINEIFDEVFVINRFSANDDLTEYFGDKNFIVNKILSKLGPKEKYVDFFNKNYNFMKSVLDVLDEQYEDIKQKEEEYLTVLAKEIIEKAKSPNHDLIEAQNKSFKKCEDVVKYGMEYNETGSQDSLNRLALALKELDLITYREYRFLIYQKDEEEIEEEIPVIEEPVKNEPTVKKELEIDYFGEKDTNCIICFLRDSKGKDIMHDLNKELSKPAKISALTELVRIFKGYIEEKDFYVELGKGPAKYIDENNIVNALLEPPYNFNYRRIGTNQDPFRIHAIHRYSKLLNELGFGTGNIMFFGAVGPVYDDTKSPTYQNVGKRAIDTLKYNNQESILNSNFDAIEHITRSYIPTFLLSEEDKKRVKEGKFNSKDKSTGKERNINKEYFLYDSLDEESKGNVMRFLKQYFTMQSSYMFNIINEYEKIKDNSLS